MVRVLPAFDRFARQLGRGFDPGEVRGLAVLLAIVLWATYAVNLGTAGPLDRGRPAEGGGLPAVLRHGAPSGRRRRRRAV